MFRNPRHSSPLLAWLCVGVESNMCSAPFPCCHPRTPRCCAHHGPPAACVSSPSSPHHWGNALAFIRAGHLCSVSPALPRRARCSVSFVLPPSSPAFGLEIWLALGSSQLVFFCAPFEWLPSKFNGPLLLPSLPPVDFSSI